MDKESLTEQWTLTMTPCDRMTLEWLAQQRGATLSGVIRRLIRDAGISAEPPERQQRSREDSDNDL